MLGVVSPDASIRNVTVDEAGQAVELWQVLAAVEIKSSFPADNKRAVHYTISEYYVCHCVCQKLLF